MANEFNQVMYIPDSNIHTALAGGRDLQGYSWQDAFVVSILQAQIQVCTEQICNVYTNNEAICYVWTGAVVEWNNCSNCINSYSPV